MQHHETFIEENKNIIYELDRKISFTTTKWVCSSSMSTTILEIKWKQKDHELKYMDLETKKENYRNN